MSIEEEEEYMQPHQLLTKKERKRLMADVTSDLSDEPLLINTFHTSPIKRKIKNEMDKLDSTTDLATND